MAAALLAATLLLSAACSDVPRPFAHQGPADNALLRLQDSAGVVVAAPGGAPPETAARLADELSKALAAANVPASVGGGNLQSYLLTSRATVRPSGAGREEIMIDWALIDGGGTPVGEFAQRYKAPNGSWRVAAAKVVQAIARQAAPHIARLIQDDSALEAPPPRVFVAEVSGAPGDGNTALRRGLEARLAGHVVHLAEQGGGENTFTVEGTVVVAEPQGDTQDVRISWRVLDAAGQERGTVDQANTVAAGSLDGEWGAVAFAVTDAAVGGILAIVDEVLRARARR
ncbi:MAG: hypothetical protein ACE5JZ_03440 [Kiloniellales bacterium]